VSRELPFAEALLGLMACLSGVGALALATLSWIDGYGWQTAVFAIGGIFTLSWGWARLTGRA
jgi:hypothetical protein